MNLQQMSNGSLRTMDNLYSFLKSLHSDLSGSQRVFEIFLLPIKWGLERAFCENIQGLVQSVLLQINHSTYMKRDPFGARLRNCFGQQRLGFYKATHDHVDHRLCIVSKGIVLSAFNN